MTQPADDEFLAEVKLCLKKPMRRLEDIATDNVIRRLIARIESDRLELDSLKGEK